MKAPCKGCQDRHLNCHSTCEKYLEFKDWNEKRLADERALNGADAARVESMLRTKYRTQGRAGSDKIGRNSDG